MFQACKQLIVDGVRYMPFHETPINVIFEMQTGLCKLGYRVGLDGICSDRFWVAWDEFSIERNLTRHNTDLLCGNLTVLIEECDALPVAPLFSGAHYRLSEPPSALNAPAVWVWEMACDLLIGECIRQRLDMREQVAYVIASVAHETQQSFVPSTRAMLQRRTESSGWEYDSRARYCGRGFIPLIGKENYSLYDSILEMDLMNYPDIVNIPSVSAFIAVHGLKTGIFTGHRITEFINPDSVDFRWARRCVGPDLDNAATFVAAAANELIPRLTML
jgi:hypothetical protein